MQLSIKRLGRELFRLLVVAALVFTAIGTGAVRADPAWTQTSQADFEAGTLFQVDTSSSPGDVKLAVDPSSEQLDQNNPNHTGHWQEVRDNRWCAQTFAAGLTGNLTRVALYLKKYGSPGQLTVEIRDCAGTSSPPGSSILASLTTGVVTTSGQEYQFVFPSPVSVTSGTHYAIVLHAAACGGRYYWAENRCDDIYPDGEEWRSYNSGGYWFTGGCGLYDLYFRTYVTAGHYSSGTLTSSIHDTGYTADFGTVSWAATTPAGTEIKFQIATNSDNSTWNFRGPDGNSGTYYTSSGAGIWSGHNGDRYIKYKAFLSTTDTGKTPALHDISLTYTQQVTPVVPPTVTSENATLVEETTATLHGTVTDDGGEACQYRFQWGTTQGGPYTDNTSWTGSKTTGQSFSADITGLGKGTKCYFRAQARNSAGTASGTELSLLTKPDPPDSAAFSATAVSSTQIDLSWAKGAGAYRTMIRRKTGDFPVDRDDGDLVYFDTGTSFSDTGLSPSTTYYYRAWSEVTGSQQWSDGYGDASATTSEGPSPPTAVGGIVYPVNKGQVLAPWLGLFLMLSLAVGGIVFGLIKKRVVSPTI